MFFLLIGFVLLGLWWAGIDPVATWPWWALALPFAVTVVWWGIADATGMTQKRAMKELDKRVLKRRLRALDAMGLGFLKDRAKQEHRRGKKRPKALPEEASRHDSHH
jgi:small Trp-rich protein